MGVGVHQGSVLSPLLFILVLEAISREFCTGVPLELLYADELVLITDTQEECISKLKAWKAGMESKRFHVNMKKTKFMLSAGDLDVLKKSRKNPCAVCCKGVGNNSIECSQSHDVGSQEVQLHHLSTGGQPEICPRCNGVSRPIGGRPMIQVDVEGTNHDVETTFCYLGDLLCSGGGCDSAIAARCCVAWGKFRKLLPLLSTRHLSPGISGLRSLGYAPR